MQDVQVYMGPKPKHSSFKPRILVVDDQVFNIEFLRCQLELIPELVGRCDYADSGESAIELVRTNLDENLKSDSNTSPYSLILLDYSMPKLDGP